jgi:hypothetical protein
LRVARQGSESQHKAEKAFKHVSDDNADQ